MLRLRHFSFCKNYRPVVSDSESDLEIPDLIEEPLVKISNPTKDQLTLLISEHIDPMNLVQIYQMYHEQFTADHLLLTLKISSRFLSLLRKYLRQPTFIETFKEISLQMNRQLDSLNAIDMMELLYCKSKFKNRGLRDLIENIEEDAFCKKLKHWLFKEDYSFRHLINILQDVVQMGIDLPEIHGIILEKLKTEHASSSEITSLLRAEVMRQKRSKKVDFTYLNLILKQVERNMESYDSDQLAMFYVYLCKLQLHLHTHDFKPVPLQFTISHHLTQRLSGLQEYSIIQLLKSTQYNSILFPLTMAASIKEMLFLAIKQRPAQISIELLYEALTSNTPRHTIFTESELNLIKEEIIVRLNGTKFIISRENPWRLYFILRQMKVRGDFEDKIYELCKQECQDYGLEYLRFVCGRNVDDIAIQQCSSERDPYRLYQLLTDCPLRVQVLQKLEQEIMKDPQAAMLQIMREPAIEQPLIELLERTIEHLTANFPVNFRQLWSVALKTMVNQRITDYWKAWIGKRVKENAWIVFKVSNVNEFQANFFHFCLLRQISWLSHTSIITLITQSNMIALVCEKDPYLVECLKIKLQLLKGGLGLVRLSQYLFENRQRNDWVKSNAKVKPFDSLYDLYKVCDVEVKIMILYILFFN